MSHGLQGFPGRHHESYEGLQHKFLALILEDSPVLHILVGSHLTLLISWLDEGDMLGEVKMQDRAYFRTEIGKFNCSL